MADFRPAGMSDESDQDSEFGYAYHPNYGEETVQEKEENSHETFWQSKLTEGIKKEDLDSKYLLIEAIAQGDVEKTKELLNSGLSCDQPLNASFAMNGQRPIFLAAQEARVEILQLLIDKGCKLNPDEGNFTPLMAVCSSNVQERPEDLAACAKILIEKIDVNTYQSQKITALMLASKQGHEQVVVELLKVPDLNLNAQDSQLWTALMYAIDNSYGNIARKLLEAGARTDLATSDGLLPIDLALSQSNSNLPTIISEYSKLRGFKMAPNEEKVIKYSEVDNILLAVEASDYMEKFKEHQVDLAEFLSLNEEDLIKIGVDKVGLRKKIIDVIADMHKRQWEKSSVAKLQPRDKQNGIYLTAPDGALIISSVGRHLKFLRANVDYLNRNLKEKPQMLLLGSDVANISDIAKFTLEARQNMSQLASTLDKLQSTVQRLSKDPQNFPLDGSRKDSVTSKLPKLFVIFGCLAAFTTAAYLRAK